MFRDYVLLHTALFFGHIKSVFFFRYFHIIVRMVYVIQMNIVAVQTNAVWEAIIECGIRGTFGKFSYGRGSVL